MEYTIYLESADGRNMEQFIDAESDEKAYEEAVRICALKSSYDPTLAFQVKDKEGNVIRR